MAHKTLETPRVYLPSKNFIVFYINTFEGFKFRACVSCLECATSTWFFNCGRKIKNFLLCAAKTSEARKRRKARRIVNQKSGSSRDPFAGYANRAPSGREKSFVLFTVGPLSKKKRSFGASNALCSNHRRFETCASRKMSASSGEKNE